VRPEGNDSGIQILGRSEELEDSSFIIAPYRVLTLMADQLRKIGTSCEKMVTVFFDATMEAAIENLGLKN
jgi:hypothetical protein